MMIRQIGAGFKVYNVALRIFPSSISSEAASISAAAMDRTDLFDLSDIRDNVWNVELIARAQISRP